MWARRLLWHESGGIHMPFSDPCFTFSRIKVLAVLAASLSAAAFFLSFVDGLYRVGNAAGPLSAVAAVLWIKSFFCVLSKTWRSAFEMGREVGHEEANGATLTPLR